MISRVGRWLFMGVGGGGGGGGAQFKANIGFILLPLIGETTTLELRASPDKYHYHAVLLLHACLPRSDTVYLRVIRCPRLYLQCPLTKEKPRCCFIGMMTFTSFCVHLIVPATRYLITSS